jgi:Na+/H+ antiporter NhaD/arsenite permease-like protein
MTDLGGTIMTMRLAVPVTAVVLGAAAWAAQAIGGDFRGGAVSFAILAAYAAVVFAFSTRSDIARVLAGNAPDERYRAIDQRALAGTGLVLILFVIGGFLWEQAHGRSGMPYTLMGAVAALAYLGSVVYGRFRG